MLEPIYTQWRFTLRRQRFYQTVRGWRGITTLATIIILLVACTSTSADPVAKSEVPPSVGPEKTLVWGKADLEPTDAFGKWQPIVDYLVADLADAGIEAGEVKISQDTETMMQWMSSGEVDLVIDSFYPAMIVAEGSGAKPLAIRNKGKAAKHAVFFTRADTRLNSLDQLQGKTIALSEPDSTSGFMLPVAHMIQEGFTLTEKESIETPVSQQEVGYLFAGDDDVAVQWVLNGRVEAAAVDNGTFKDWAESNPGQLVVLAETDSMIRDTMVLVGEHVDPALREAIQSSLLGMQDNAEGQAILKRNKAVNFIAVSEEVDLAWARTRELFHLIQQD